MDQAVTVEPYGNRDLAAGTPERPLVSLLLLAYNQENYIGAAIEGALAQTYSPLEILLSDDCSPDDATFAIMERKAQAYQGPHRVLLVRRPRNLGLIAHVNELMALASAEILVLAAGDDICLPERVGRIVEAFRDDPAALLVHSNALAIDAEGRSGEVVRGPVGADTDPMTLATAGAIYVGATGAVHRELVRRFGPITEPRAFEDLVIGFRAALLGGLRYLPETLLKYRTGIGLSSEGARVQNYSRQRLRHAEIMLATLRQRLQDLDTIGGPQQARIAPVLHDAIARFDTIRSFHDPARGATPLAYVRKVLHHGLPGAIEALRHLRAALRRAASGSFG